MNYKLTIPHSRGFKTELLDTENLETTADTGDKIRDMFLHALFARISANDNETWEFETKFDQTDNSIELQISEKFISILETVSKGEDFNRYIRWLINDAVTDLVDGLFWRLVEGSDDIIKTAFKAVFEKSASFDTLINIGDSGSASTVNWCNGNKQKILLTDDVTLSFMNPPGPAGLQLIMIQDGVGSHTPSFPANVKFSNGSQPSTTLTAGSIDIWSFLYDGTDYYATIVKNFS